MKKIGLISILALAIVSCDEDKGFYDYQDINEITVEGLAPEYNLIFKSDTLKINPELVFTMDDGNPERYEYKWEVEPERANQHPGGVISRSRTLNYFAELYPGTYTLYLKIKDTQTGLQWMKSTLLNVRTQFARGFLLIGEKEDGYTDVNMISMATDTIILRELLKDNGLPPLRNPQRIIYSGPYTSASYDNMIQLWVITGDGSYYVNTTTFEGKEENNIKRWIYASFDLSEKINPQHFFIRGGNGMMGSYRFAACDDGNIYSLSITSGPYYSNPFNRTSATQETYYKTFPFVFTSLLGTSTTSAYLLYNEEQNRFMSTSLLTITHTNSMADTPSDVFPWNQPTGRKLLYGENTNNKDNGATLGNSFALMRDADNKFYIYKFSTSTGAILGFTITKLGGYNVLPSVATNIERSKLFAFSAQRTLLLYAVGSVLYAYDYNSGNEQLYTKDFGDEITLVEFNTESNSTGNDLYIATYNPTTKGTLQKFTIGTNPNAFDLIPDDRCRWSGLVKIVDIEWRNSDK